MSAEKVNYKKWSNDDLVELLASIRRAVGNSRFEILDQEAKRLASVPETGERYY